MALAGPGEMAEDRAKAFPGPSEREAEEGVLKAGRGSAGQAAEWISA